MTVEFQQVKKDTCGRELEYLKQWIKVPDALIPQRHDVIKIHSGDYGEIVKKYRVINRVIDGDDMDKIIVVVNSI